MIYDIKLTATIFFAAYVGCQDGGSEAQYQDED